MRRKKKKVNEYRKQKQARASGIHGYLVHRSHVSGSRWLRPWVRRLHEQEMKELRTRLEEEKS